MKRFVVAGSCFEYGRAGERYEFIPPDAPLEPTLSYPTSKAAASVAFVGFAAEIGMELSIHRIFQVFGEGESENRLWPSLRRAALAGEDFAMSPGEQVRDFVPVEQVAASLLTACSHRPAEAGRACIENIGTGRPQTVRQFAEHWWAKWQATGTLHFGVKPYRDGEVMRYVPKIESTPKKSSSFDLMGVNRRIAIGVVASYVGRGMQIVLNLALLPILFRHLSEEAIGMWYLLGASHLVSWAFGLRIWSNPDPTDCVCQGDQRGTYRS